MSRRVLVIEREHVAEQDVQKIDVGALDGNDGDAERKRKQIECRQGRIFLELGRAGDETGEQGDDESGDQAARRHRKQVESGEQESDRGPGQDCVRHGVADQAHAPQHQKHADGAGAERERKLARKRATHELELGERGNEEVV